MKVRKSPLRQLYIDDSANDQDATKTEISFHRDQDEFVSEKTYVAHEDPASKSGPRIKLIDPQGRRKHHRFQGQVTALLSTERHTFRTTTVNISSGGALFQDLLPPGFIDRTIDCVIVLEHQDHRREYINVRGRLLNAPLRSNRISFMNAPLGLQETLHSYFG